MTENTGLLAGIYVRISQDAEDEGLGVARQRRDCESLAERLGWQVAEIYEDNDISASTGKLRPAYTRMTKDIESGYIRGVIVWDVDRLTRTPRELEDIIDWADKHRLSLANVGGEIDLSTPQGRMTARIKGAVARHEVEQSSRRIRRKNLELAEAGRHSGQRPYGWDKPPDKSLVINEAEAAVIRDAVNSILEGESMSGIVTRLNARGVPTLKGNEWNTVGLRSVVKRWRNCGVRTYHGKEMGKGLWEPLYSREKHERLLALLNDPSRAPGDRTGATRGNPPKYLLSHLIQCAECGSPLAGSKPRNYMVTVRLAEGPVKRERKFPARYDCRKIGCQAVGRFMEELDLFVSEYVIALLEREGVQVLGGDDDAAKESRDAISALEAKLSLISDQFVSDLITADQFQRMTAQLRPRLEQAKRNLERAMPPTEGLKDFAGPTARSAWEKATVEQRRHILKTLKRAGMKIVAGKTGRRGGQQDFSALSITWEGI